MLALVALATVCGGRVYSTADVQSAFGDYSLRTVVPPGGLKPSSSATFATLAAVTDLRIDPGTADPVEVYAGSGISIARFRSAHEAWLAAAQFALLKSEVVGLKVAGFPQFIGRRGNLLLVVLRSDEAKARADLARLH